MQAPMGRAVIGGVITSTLLTLVVVPVLLHVPRPAGTKRAVRGETDAAPGARHSQGGAGPRRPIDLTCG